MKDIHRTKCGLVWREIETVEEAMRIGEVTRTAFGYFYAALDGRGANNNRYFALGDDAKVIGCTPRVVCAKSKATHAFGLPLFVGYMNGDPFPEYADQIQELAAAIGVEITESHYPNRRQIPQDEAPSP